VPETERLLLRGWREGDLDAYARITADPEVMRHMFPPRPQTREEAALDVLLMQEHWHEHGFGHWVAEEKETGRLVGRVGVKRHRDWHLDPQCTEVGWLLDRAVWGRGLATEGARAAVAYCFDELERPEVISIARPENAASRRVMEKSGLSLAGRRLWEERNLDVVWYSRRA
jgi:RimJ/RimL family protein N-acetyltransferase